MQNRKHEIPVSLISLGCEGLNILQLNAHMAEFWSEKTVRLIAEMPPGSNCLCEELGKYFDNMHQEYSKAVSLHLFKFSGHFTDH